MLKNSRENYGNVTRAIHWIVALLVIFMLCLGLYMGGVKDMSTKLQLFNLHKSIGACILFLVVIRICWHQYSKTPEFLSSLKNWEKISARAVHFLLYIAMLGMPLSGWLLSSAAGRPVHVFGLFTLPDLIGLDKPLSHRLGDVHGVLAYILIGLIVLHAGGALKHYFIDRDGTLQRMLPLLKTPAKKILLAAAVLYPLSLSSPALAAMGWTNAPAESVMMFDSGVGHMPVTGFAPDVAFDPDDLPGSRIVIRADLYTAFIPLQHADPDMVAMMRNSPPSGKINETSPGFAVFTSSSITRQGGKNFVMSGDLSLNGRSKQVAIPFSVSLEKNAAGPHLVMAGAITLNPKDFAGDKLTDPGVAQLLLTFSFTEYPAG